MDNFLINPFTRWAVNFACNTYILHKNRDKHLHISKSSKLRNCGFGLYNTIYDNVTLGNVEIDDFTYVAKGSSIYSTHIGKFCSIGPHVRCGVGLHPTQAFVSTHPAFYSIKQEAQVSFVEKSLFEENKKIIIGHDVWIGINAIILDGVTIGDGAIIGAGSVVNKDVQPYSIVRGIPAQISRKRFSQGDINFLLSFKWWENDLEWLKKNASFMRDIHYFRKVIEKTSNS